MEAVRAHAGTARTLRRQRPLLELASREHLNSGVLGRELRDEEEAERAADAAHWRPRREKLARLRPAARRQ